MKQVSNIKIAITLIVFIGVAMFAFGRDFDTGYKVMERKVDITYSEEKGFTPSTVVVKKGTVVRFVNSGSGNFWPASDFYPQNSNYPGFDPKTVVDGGEWSFGFDLPGTWGYHDNLKPINKGVIVVVEPGGYFTRSKTGCKNLNSLNYGGRQLCWYKDIKKVVSEGGVKKAFTLFKELYSKEPLFSQGCHDVMHLIGDEAYREYRKGVKLEFDVETTYCGYGFYHGFIEAMLYTTGDYSEVKDFCESTNSNLKTDIESSNAIYSCYHGIGHSTFDAHDPSLWGSEEKMVAPAIDTCESVTEGMEQEKTKQCVTGVFNALGIAYTNQLYGFQMDPKDPVWYCRKLVGQYKKACFIETSIAWISSQMGDYDYSFIEAAKFIEGLSDLEGETAAMFSLSSEYSRIHINDISNSNMVANCRTVKKSLFPSCLDGVELALLNWGKPGEEFVRALSLCSEEDFTASERNVCFGYIFRNLSNMYPREKRLDICNSKIDSEYKEKCINMN